MFLSILSFILVVFSIQVEAVGKSIPPAALWCESCATRDFYNDAAKLKWVNKNDGDWIDADGVEQGSKPFATVDVPDKDVATEFNFDVAVIVNRWLSKEIAEQGFALRCTNKVRWRAKDAPETSEHARLELESPSGEKVVAKVIGDVHLAPSTYTNRGADAAVSCESGVLALFRFDVSGIETWSSVKSAQLVLTSFQVYSGLGKASVFLPDAGRAYLKGVAPVSTGFAVNYKDDKNIASDESVFYATSFEEDEWLTVSANQRTSVGDADIGHTDNINAVKPDYSEFGFSPWQGNALRVLWRKGSNYGGTVSYKFAKNGPEPDHAFFRYYIRLADDWGTMSDGGKMAGFAGRNNGRCGWGGRRSDGQCWSARGTYAKSISGDDNPLNTATPFGNYQYHIDQATTYGDVNYWTDSLNGNLFKNQWHCVEQEVQMNTVGQADGLIRAWVDGRLAYTRQNMRWRTIADLHIEEVWMNWYHGGTATIPEDMHLFVDSLVVAKKRIGCMSSSSATLPPTNPTSAPSPTDAPSTNAPPSNGAPATNTPATGSSGTPAPSSTVAAETTSPSSIVTVAPIVVLIVSLLTLLIL